jgi:hypothetical protein
MTERTAVALAGVLITLAFLVAAAVGASRAAEALTVLPF